MIREYDRLSAVVGVTFFVSAVLRLYRIGDESLWLDEATSVSLVTHEYTTLGLLFELPFSDPHPPVYFLILDGWVAVFGTSEGTIRLLSALFGIGSIILLYVLGRKAVDREAGLVAAGLLGLSPFHIYYSQEARMYTLLAFLTILSFYFYVDMVDLRGDLDQKTIVGYIAATVILGYTHVFGLFVILAQNIYIGLRVLGRKSQSQSFGSGWSAPVSLSRWIGSQAVVGVLLGPWIGVLFLKVVGTSTGADSSIAWISPPSLIDIPFAIGAFLFGGGVHQYSGVWVKIGALGIVAGLAMVGVVGRVVDGEWRIGPTPSAVMFLVLFLTPLLGAFLLSVFVTPIFIVRYLIVSSIGLFLLVGIGISTLGTSDKLRSLPGREWSFPIDFRHVILGFLLMALVVHLPAYYGVDQKQQWREAVTMVESSAATGSAVLITDEFMDTPYRYYAERSDVALVPIDDQAAADQIRMQIHGYDEIWVVHSQAKSESVIGFFEKSADFAITARWEHEFNGIRIYEISRNLDSN